MLRKLISRSALTALAMLALSGTAFAEDKAAEPQNPAGLETATDESARTDAANVPGTVAEPESTEERLSKLEDTVGVIASELSKAVADDSVPEEKLEGVWGFGPAASKVYRKDHGLSIGGYGEVRIRTFTSEANNGKKPDTIADTLRAVFYVGYKFTDKWLVNSELEFEHSFADKDKGGSVGVEFLNLDFMALDNHGIRAGLLLVPMGFVNEIHEPTFFFGAERPEVERQIIPSTWREVGGGAFGQFFDGRVSYRAYGINGFNAQGFKVSGLRGGRQKGSKALANQWAFVGRVDVDVCEGLLLGGSIYTGNSGQDQTDSTSMLAIPDTLTTLYELHAEYKTHGLSFRALFTQAFLSDTGALNVALGNAPNMAVAERMLGAYAEAAYDVLPLVFKDTRASLEPFFRYERLDTQNAVATGFVKNGLYRQDIYTAGVNFKPIPNVVFKLDYRNFVPESGKVANQVQLSTGYVF